MRQVGLFLVTALIGIAALPAANLVRWLNGNEDAGRAMAEHDFFNLDLPLAMLSAVVSPLGISVDPDQVVIGHDGWLFLGNHYDESLHRRRIGGYDVDDQLAAATVDKLVGWRAWLLAQGVADFRVLIGPNKSTQYPDHMPGWVDPQPGTPLDRIMAVPGAGSLITDPRAALTRQDVVPGAELYFRTDTHWNTFAGAIAARDWLGTVDLRGQRLTLPGIRDPLVVRRAAGDLSEFLRLTAVMKDRDIDYAFDSPVSIETVRTLVETAQEVGRGGNPEIPNQMRPLMVTSPNAANRLRVLWIRDSFGTAVSKYMAGTFTDVIHVHYDTAFASDGQMLRDLTRDWQPDLVLLTVVERRSIAPFLGPAPRVPGG
jgi:alginate O-acetyltransferase complex protein AlgJ